MNPLDGGAIFSPCGQYRYRLWRRWSAGVAPVVFIMLNPSTADAEHDDPTIRKCKGFARRLGQGAIEVVNLYAYRTSSPRALRAAGWPVGPENNAHILEACRGAEYVIAAWGTHPTARDRPRVVLEMLAAKGIGVEALALTAAGDPRHPLMLPYRFAEGLLRRLYLPHLS